MSHVINNVITNNAGIFLPVMVQEFGCDISTASWVGSIALAFWLGAGQYKFTTMLVNCNNLFITGVVAGKLIAVYGPRPVALLSTVIYVAALVISSYVNKVEVMFVTYGMLRVRNTYGPNLMHVAGLPVGFASCFANMASMVSSCDDKGRVFIVIPLHNTRLLFDVISSSASGWRLALYFLAVGLGLYMQHS